MNLIISMAFSSTTGMALTDRFLRLHLCAFMFVEETEQPPSVCADMCTTHMYVCVCVCVGVRACVLVACRMNERNLNSIRPGLVRLEEVYVEQNQLKEPPETARL